MAPTVSSVVVALTCALTLHVSSGSTAAKLEIVAEWSTVEYEWPSPEERSAAVANGSYIPEHCTVTGVKVWGDTLFVTVPRWSTGVPATLNTVVHDADGSALLRPWPSVSEQDPTDCSKLQYVQSMEITPDGVMWVIDAGRKYFAKPPNSADNSCPPKIILLDVQTGNILETYVFPNQVAPYDGSFLNDIAVDDVNQIAYITSTGNNATDEGSVVVFNRRVRSSRRFTDASMHADPVPVAIVIHGKDYTEAFGGFPVDGIALTPQRDRLFYSPLGGRQLYSLDARVLGDFGQPDSAVVATIIHHGAKPSNCDGMAFGADGSLFFGGITTNSLYRWHPGQGQVSETVPEFTDANKLWWVDTFGFDDAGNLYLVSDRLDMWFGGGMDFSGASGSNFKIVKVNVGTGSYLEPVPELVSVRVVV